MRGGAREGAGRTSLPDSKLKNKIFTLKCTEKEREIINDLISKCKKKKEKSTNVEIIIESLKNFSES